MEQQLDPAAEAIRAGIEGMPLNTTLGIRIVDMSGGRALARLTDRPELANHLGAVHSAAQYGLIEAAGGASAASAFLDLLGDAIPYAQGAQVQYHRPARGMVSAEAVVDPEDARRAREDLDRQGLAHFEIEVRVLDDGGTATEAVLHWSIRRTPR